MAGYHPQRDLEVLREHYEIFCDVVRRVQRNWDLVGVNQAPDVRNFVQNVTFTNPFAGRRIIRMDGQGGPDYWHMADEAAIPPMPETQQNAVNPIAATVDPAQAAEGNGQDPDIRTDPRHGRKITWSPTREVKQLPEPDMTGLDPFEKKKVADELLRERAQKRAQDKRELGRELKKQEQAAKTKVETEEVVEEEGQ